MSHQLTGANTIGRVDRVSVHFDRPVGQHHHRGDVSYAMQHIPGGQRATYAGAGVGHEHDVNERCRSSSTH